MSVIGPDYCYSCNRDEPGGLCFRICGECGHVFRTRREILRRHRAFDWKMIRDAAWFSTRWHYGKFRILWRLRHVSRVRQARLAFCPLCNHDF